MCGVSTTFALLIRALHPVLDYNTVVSGLLSSIKVFVGHHYVATLARHCIEVC